MFNRKHVVLRFNEKGIDIGVLSKGIGSLKLKMSKFIGFNNDNSIGSPQFNTDVNRKELRTFFRDNKFLPRKVNVVLSIEGIITRLVECPYMKRVELEEFIANNIDEYFTLNVEDYSYDYKIMDHEKGDVEKLVILLAAFPKALLSDITGILKSCDLLINQISIYPECISNLFHEKSSLSLAVFDINRDKSSVTLLDKGKIFLYSRMSAELGGDENESYEELLDNMGYFLNFYSTRHFGNRVDRLYIVGELWNDVKLRAKIKDQFDIDNINGVKLNRLKLSCHKNLDKNLFCDIYGSLVKIKNISKKQIDFNQPFEFWKERDSKGQVSIKAVALCVIIITFLLIGTSIGYIQYMMYKYDPSPLNEQIASLSEVEKEYGELNRLKNEYTQKENQLKELDKSVFNYTSYLEALGKGLPENVAVKRIILDREDVSISIAINNSTLDKANLVTSINNIGIFETLEIDTIKLDDSETSADFTLKIRNPL